MKYEGRQDDQNILLIYPNVMEHERVLKKIKREFLDDELDDNLLFHVH